LVAEPNGDVEAAYAVMAIADYVFVDVERLEMCGNLAHGDQLGACDAAEIKFPGFADIDQQEFFAAIEALSEFGGS